MAVPVTVGWVAGDAAAGLIATIGGFTALYGSGRPYLNRAMYLGAIAVSFAIVVVLGELAAATAWSAVLVVTAIAMIAVLICHALSVGPPGAYMPVLACAAGTGVATTHLSSWHLGTLVLAGGAFSWLAHMVGALWQPRGPERSAVAAAGEAVAKYIESPDAAARHHAAQLLHQSWVTLVTFQPVHPKPDGTLYRLRITNRRLHRLFAEAMAAADHDRPLPAEAAAQARELAQVPDDIGDPAVGVDPLGRPSAATLLRQAVRPGSASMQLALRAAAAVALAGAVASALNIHHSYWAMAAAMLMLHQGIDWQRTVQRGVERTVGTWIGLGLAGVILTVAPTGPWLALTVGALQFGIEMFVVRNYTIIGCAIGLLVLCLAHRGRRAVTPDETLAATLAAVATVVGHLLGGSVSTVQARTDRRDLQLNAIAMLSAYETAAGGTTRVQAAAGRLWPAIAATDQLAYRALAACWSAETSTAPTDTDRPAAMLADLNEIRTSLTP